MLDSRRTSVRYSDLPVGSWTCGELAPPNPEKKAGKTGHARARLLGCFRSVCVLLPLLSTTFGQAAEPTKEEIARAIQQLGDDDAAVRQKASQLLWEAGAAAEPALQAATKGGDADVVLRAAAILDKFRWGIHPDTPAEVVDLIKAYRAAPDDPGREKAIRGLIAKGSKGLSAVRKIMTADGNPQSQALVNKLLTTAAVTAVPGLVAEDRFAEVEELLAAAVVGRDRPTLQNYAACLMLRDRVEAVIAELEPKAGDPAMAQILAYLYRAKGDLPKAVAHARTARDEQHLDTLLVLARDWEALRDRLSTRPNMDEGTLGLLLTAQFRTGKKDDAAKTVTTLKERADAKPVGNTTVWLSAKPLFVNGLTDQALEILPRANNPAMILDVLAAQFRYREAMELAARLRKASDKGWMTAEVRRARMLRELGERKKADALLDELVKDIDNAPDDAERRDLLALLVEVGRKDQAFEVAASLFTKNGAVDPAFWSPLFSKDRGKQAATWWAFHHRGNTVPPFADTLKSVRALMEGTVEKKQSMDTFEAALKWAKELPKEQRVFDGPLLGLADWCVELKHRDREQECLRAELEILGDVPSSAAVFQRLGENLAGEREWKAAAEAFRKAWEKDRTQGAPLWLWGWAVEKGGDAEEAARLMERARWVPLGDEVKRSALAKVMGQKGRQADERREFARTHKLALLDSWHMGEALRSVFAAADQAKDYATAADALDQTVLRVMRRNTYYLEYRSWATQPARVHFQQARALMAAGKVEEAVEEVDAGWKIVPGDITGVIHMVPALEKLGKTKEADALFAKVSEVYAGLLADYPNWAGGHNNVAWMSVRCRRNLDEALKHAQKAVELEPERAGYLDTLAEVHFQKGDTAKAIELMKKALEREPERELYKNQLKRFEAGDPKVEVPESR